MALTPTEQLYGSLQIAYNHFNKNLFDNELPPVLFTTQRQKNVMGYFSLERWASTEGDKCSEIAINPSYVGRSAIIELLQTLVHEMAHCWQHSYGKPSRSTYHNKEWAAKMESIGLMPSSTGAVGGKKTGQNMNDYPIPGGRFIQECKSLMAIGFGLPWVDRLAAYNQNAHTLSTEIEALNLNEDELHQLTSSFDLLIGEDSFERIEQEAKGKTKPCYVCPSCSMKVWGKPGLKISCDSCSQALIVKDD